VPGLSVRVAAVFAATLAANFVVMGWGRLSLIFADMSHPAEMRVSTAAISAVYIAILLSLSLATAVLVLFAQVLPRAARPLATGVIYAACWTIAAFAIAGLLVTEDMGLTWAPHEPFVELFFQPILTPALLIGSLALVMRLAAQGRR
jgi:hypothetical protein